LETTTGKEAAMFIAAIALFCIIVTIAISAYMWRKGTPPQKKLARKGQKDAGRKT